MTKPLTQRTDATVNGTGQKIVSNEPEGVVVLLSVPRTHLIRICTRASVS